MFVAPHFHHSHYIGIYHAQSNFIATHKNIHSKCYCSPFIRFYIKRSRSTWYTRAERMMENIHTHARFQGRDPAHVYINNANFICECFMEVIWVWIVSAYTHYIDIWLTFHSLNRWDIKSLKRYICTRNKEILYTKVLHLWSFIIPI